MAKQRDSKVDFWLTEDGLMLIRSWARDTFSKSEIADRMGVNLSTLVKWQEKYEEIDEAIRTSKEFVDYQVECALLKAALGYRTKEVKVTVGKKVVNGEVVEMLKETTTREVPPNVNAAIFWLNNRKFDEWKRNRDKVVEVDPDDQQVTITIQRGAKQAITISDGTDDEINDTATYTVEELEQAQGEVADGEDWDEDEWEEYDGDEDDEE